jgi:hypothetical protein
MSDIAPRSPATGLGHGTARQILEQRRGHAYDAAAVDVGVDGWCDLGEGLWQAVLDVEREGARPL